jgi:hypothetical protein
MIRRRAAAAGIATKVGNHSFRGTGISSYLQNGARWRRPRKWRTTPACAPRGSMIDAATNFSRDEVERIRV